MKSDMGKAAAWFLLFVAFCLFGSLFYENHKPVDTALKFSECVVTGKTKVQPEFDSIDWFNSKLNMTKRLEKKTFSQELFLYESNKKTGALEWQGSETKDGVCYGAVKQSLRWKRYIECMKADPDGHHDCWLGATDASHENCVGK